MIRSNVFLAAMIITYAALIGCGGPKTGTVNGSVTHAGQPVAFGQISFIGADGWTGNSSVRDGNYKIDDVPLGSVKVVVQAMQAPMPVNPPPTPGTKAPPPPKIAPFKPLPPQYADAAMTPLSYEVTAGEQSKNFDIAK